MQRVRQNRLGQLFEERFQGSTDDIFISFLCLNNTIEKDTSFDGIKQQNCIYSNEKINIQLVDTMNDKQGTEEGQYSVAHRTKLEKLK